MERETLFKIAEFFFWFGVWFMILAVWLENRRMREQLKRMSRNQVRKINSVKFEAIPVPFGKSFPLFRQHQNDYVDICARVNLKDNPEFLICGCLIDAKGTCGALEFTMDDDGQNKQISNRLYQCVVYDSSKMDSPI